MSRSPHDTGASDDRRQIRTAAWVLGGVLLFFAVMTVVIFVLRWNLMPDPWRVL